MIWIPALRLAGRALRRNKMRSALTALGVIIGVAALIVTVAAGEGAKSMLNDQIASLGTNMLIVLPGTSTSGGIHGGAGTGRPLTRDDVAEITRNAPAVKYAAPVDRTVVQMISANQNWSSTVYGTTPEFFAIRDWQIARGRFFLASEVDSAAKVCVLGQTVAENLFGGQDPVGETIRVKQMPCEIVGVLQRKGQSSQGQDQDDMLVMPSPTYKSRMLNQNRNYIGSMLLSATSSQDMDAATQQVTAILRQKHHLQDGADDDFTVRNLADIAATQQKMVDTQTGMLRNVAAVSLLVGGIGIMNIMLVSVTERTREIGVRLAIGARERDILLQFLVEAVVLSAMGGLIGIGLGVAGSFLVAFLMEWPVLVTPFWIGLAFTVSCAIGVVFGFYPARKAARLDPIDALRYE
jgi:putative ABC transport system permease protein